ncbi:EXS family protein [Cryptosporidium muris RN66]|uniref:EXS family protein n=1 Tax=Cryptosporidium muris (strain RN66) TaxID=441375 RepID=B6ABE6_CRYMR|nr:EXS family protein [Cryptosporidium muris RN66]EEA05698.1 EXS family protein [Cryptosporidium muris RN66]|eukprot:XP_002140047.1 EXS family protein [Cryptosporidium muris RN66]
MKFVDKLEQYEESRWSGKYIEYRYLNCLLSRRYFEYISSERRASFLFPEGITQTKKADKVLYSILQQDIRDSLLSKLETFHYRLQLNIKTTTQHFVQVKYDIESHLDIIFAMLSNEYSPRNVIQYIPAVILNIWRTLDELQEYIALNNMAVYKLCNKRDELFANYIDILPNKDIFLECFADMKIDENIRDNIIKFYAKSREMSTELFNPKSDVKFSDIESVSANGTSVIDYSPKLSPKYAMFELEAQVEHTRRTKKLLNRPLINSDFLMFFMLGICSVLLMNLFIICKLPATNKNYSIDGVLAVFPLFRLVLMVILVIWGAGLSISIMDYYGINYKYMIEMDPKCSVTSMTLFTFATLQTIIWLVMFSIFLIDYKLEISVFKYLNSTSHLLWLYPIILMLIETSLLFIPSNDFLFEYRKSIFKSIVEVFSHGIVPKICIVTLRANIVGDILTTLSKPFGDIEYTLAFLFFIIKTRGDIFPSSIFLFLSKYRWMQTFALALPYEIRFCQCGMRYLTDHSPKRKNHLYNMGKYTAGLLIAIISTVPWHNITNISPFIIRLLWFTSYIVGTIYMFSWDIYMDWGLMPDHTSFVRPKGMYPNWYYYSVAFYNLIGRLTWAITLIPITIIDDIKINATIINLCVSIIEILRRSLWCTIRLEWEQVHLNPKQPAALWVTNNNYKAL